MFDWTRFLDQHSIDYVTQGPNVARGNVNVRCPFCGSEDQSHHLGISLNGQGWGCWRRPDHRGKSPIRLVRALIGCSVEQARRIVGGSTFIPDDFLAQVQSAVGREDGEAPSVGSLEMPPEFRPFKDLPSARLFVNYLRQRNFTDKQIFNLTTDYGLRYCTQGPYKGRVIFPVRFEKRLVCWTGRTVYPSVTIRYKTLSDDPEKAALDGMSPAIAPLNHFLLWYDDLLHADADTIYLVEGPFDALKVRVLGRREGITATCLFTAHETQEQAALLHELLPRFRNKFVMLDRAMFVGSVRIASSLVGLGVSPKMLPDRVKDPGELRTVDELLAI